MKRIIARDYARITSREEMKRMVQQLWDEYPDDKWNWLTESMQERM